jgi:hypothetical protein
MAMPAAKARASIDVDGQNFMTQLLDAYMGALES